MCVFALHVTSTYSFISFTTDNISTSSQLGCLLSMEASRERTHYERISSMKTFFTSMAGQRYDLHTKISDIPLNDLKVRSLTLMLCY